MLQVDYLFTTYDLNRKGGMSWWGIDPGDRPGEIESGARESSGSLTYVGPTHVDSSN